MAKKADRGHFGDSGWLRRAAEATAGPLGWGLVRFVVVGRLSSLPSLGGRRIEYTPTVGAEYCSYF